MDFLELVTGARTCRRFREAEGMPAGMLDWLIACARVTPCGGNAQALRFAVAVLRIFSYPPFYLRRAFSFVRALFFSMLARRLMNGRSINCPFGVSAFFTCSGVNSECTYL